MGTVRQVLHLFRKAARTEWVPAMGLAACAATFPVALAVRAEPGAWVVVALPFLALLLGILALAGAIHQDSPIARRAWWRTLPISDWALVGAWAVFLFVVAGVLVVGFTVPWLHAHGIGGTALARELGLVAVLVVAWLLATACLAAVTPNLRVFTVVLLIAVVGAGFLTDARANAMPPQMEPASEAMPEDVRPGAVLVQAWLSHEASQYAVALSVAAEDPAAGAGTTFHLKGFEVRAPGGRVRRVRVRPASVALHVPSVLAGDGTHDSFQVLQTHPAEPEPVTFTPQLGTVVAELAEPGAEIVLLGDLEIVRPRSLGSVPAGGGPLRAPGMRIEVYPFGLEAGAPSASMYVSTASRGRPETDRFVGSGPWGRAPVTAGTLAAVFVHSGRREGVAAVPVLRGHAAPTIPLVGWIGRINVTAAPPGASFFTSTPDTPPSTIVDASWIREAELRLYEWTEEGRYPVEIGPVPLLPGHPGIAVEATRAAIRPAR